MIHRAILGSLERFIGVLIEHTGGVLPFWLAPEQARVLSLSEKVEEYAAEIAATLKREGFRATSDIRNEKLGFKVREAELAKVPYMVVVGEREAAARSVSLRMLRGDKSRGDGAGGADRATQGGTAAGVNHMRFHRRVSSTVNGVHFQIVPPARGRWLIRRDFRTPPSREPAIRVNQVIRATEVRVIDSDGQQSAS